MAQHTFLWLWSLCLLAAACEGTIGATTPLDGDPRAPIGPRPTREFCEENGAYAEDAPLRRLNATELRNTLDDLFPGVTLPELVLTSPRSFEGYTTHALSQPTDIQQETAASLAVADVASANLVWAPCDEPSSECLGDIIDGFLPRAYRRPPSADELADAQAFGAEALQEFGFEAAIRDVVAYVLLSPQFLFRPELSPVNGDGVDGPVALDGYALANRLSYLLTRTMPDDGLMDAAASGRLDDAEGIAEEARRLLATPKARGAVVDFFRQWAEMDAFTSLHLSASAFPEFDAELLDSLRESLDRFIEYAVWEERSFDALLNSEIVFADARLAEALGARVEGDEAQPIELPNRHGLLTQPGYLASSSHEAAHAPVLRGLRIMDRVTCTGVGAPPEDVNAAVPDREEGDVRTTRQHLEETHTTDPSCRSCHDLIDGIGFAFENYDALGRWRTEEYGLPVDAQTEFTLGTDVYAVRDGVDLAAQLSGTETVRACISGHLHRYAMGYRADAPGDLCEIEGLADAWVASSGDPLEMLVALVTSPSFRARPAR